MKLLIPPDYGIINMVAIDPGLNTCGVSIFELDTLNKNIVSISSFTIETEKLSDDSCLFLDLVSDRFVKIYKLCNCLRRIIEITNAKIVVSEAPFYNRLMPMAYGALLEVVSSIQKTVVSVSNDVQFEMYAPQLVKKHVGAAGKKGKDIIKESIEKIPHLLNKVVSDYSLLDEHSIDSIAVGHTYLEVRSGENVWT